MRRIRLIIIAAISSVIMAGCLYPESERMENDIPDEVQIDMVQDAVDAFREDSGGLLPIKTLENQREYLEYQIDFGRLVPEYLNERPANAYESGGHYQYVVLDAEDDPTVKLADLRIIDEVRSLTIRLNTMGDHVMLDEPIGPNVYPLDLGFYKLEEDPTVTSPYTGGALNVYYSGGEEFIVDYRTDIGRIIEDNNLEFETGEDVRHILYEYTPIVPVYSPEITVDEENRPIFMTSRHKSD